MGYMMDNTIRNQERENRWADLQSASDMHADVCLHVASGGTVESLAELWDIPGGWIMAFMVDTPAKRLAFESACVARDAWISEALTRQAIALSTSDVRGMLDDDGTVRPRKEWPADLAKCIQSFDVSVDKDGNPSYRVKLYDKLKAIELAGRRVGTFQPSVDVKVSGSLDLASIVKESMQGDTGS